MTTVAFDFRDSSRGAIDGLVRCRVGTRVHVDGDDDFIILPQSFDVNISAGIGSAEFAPDDGIRYCWVIEEEMGHGSVTRFVHIPESATAVDYGDLQDVDPRTLLPDAEPQAAWWLLADSLPETLAVVNGNLVVTRVDGSTYIAGYVVGPPGPVSDAGMTAIANDPASAFRASLNNSYGTVADVAAKLPKSAASVSTLDSKGPSQSANALRYFRSGVALRATQKCKMVHIGDSITEGEKSSTLRARWSDLLLDSLSQRFKIAGAASSRSYYVAAQSGTTSFSYAAYVARVGGTNNSDYGLGRWAVFLNTTGATLTLTTPEPVSAIEVVYENGGGGTFTVTLDGGTPSTGVVTTGSIAAVRYNVAGLTGTANHTVTVTQTTGNAIILGFVLHVGSRTTGFESWNAGRGGAPTAYFADAAKPRWIDTVTLVQPDLITISIGANDFKTVVPPATFKGYLQTLITNVKAASPQSSIVLLPQYGLGSTPNTTYPWLDYVTVQYEIVAADPTLALCDMQARTGMTVPPTTRGMISADNQHLTDAGNVLWADALETFLIG